MLGRLINRPHEGNLTGQCKICGIKTERGHRAQLSEKFTQGSLLYAGTVICEFCYPLVKDPAFRRRSFLIRPSEVQFGKLTEIGRYILHPVAPPFFLYLTTTGKRYGYLRAVHAVSYSTQKFYVVNDWTTPILMNAEEVKTLWEIAQRFLAQGVSRTSLREGLRDVKVVERLLKKGVSLRDVQRVQALHGYPQWEVICYVCS